MESSTQRQYDGNEQAALQGFGRRSTWKSMRIGSEYQPGTRPFGLQNPDSEQGLAALLK